MRLEIGFVRDFFHFGFRFGFSFGFRELGAQGAEAIEFLDGAAVLPLSLGLVTQKELPGVGLLSFHLEASGELDIVILGQEDTDIAAWDGALRQEGDVVFFEAEGSLEAGVPHAGFEAGGAEECRLAEGDAFDGEDFLGVDGAIEIEGILAEAVDGLEAFEVGDGEGGTGEAVFAGVESGLGFAGVGAGAGGFLRVDAVSGDLFFRGHWVDYLSNSEVAWRRERTGG